MVQSNVSEQSKHMALLVVLPAAAGIYSRAGADWRSFIQFLGPPVLRLGSLPPRGMKISQNISLTGMAPTSWNRFHRRTGPRF